MRIRRRKKIDTLEELEDQHMELAYVDGPANDEYTRALKCENCKQYSLCQKEKIDAFWCKSFLWRDGSPYEKFNRVIALDDDFEPFEQ